MESMLEDIKGSIKGNVYVALKSSISISAIAIIIIWFYLFSVGRQDIFLDAINNIPSLIVIVGFSIFLFVFFVSVFMFSSLVTIWMFKIYQKEIANYQKVGSHLTRICVTNSIVFWGLLFALFLLVEKTIPSNGYLYTASLIASTLVAVANSLRMVSKRLLLASNFKDLNITKTYVPLHNKRGEKWLFSTMLLAPAWVQIFPLMFIFSRLDFGDIHNDYVQFGMALLLVLIVSFFTMLPAVAWFSTPQERGVLYKYRDAFLAMIATLFIIFTLFRPFSDIVVGSSLRLIGVIDWNPHHYLLSNDKFSAGLFPGQEWNTRTYHTVPQRFFITGVPIFTLGNVQLICPTAVLTFRERSMREDISDLSSHQRRVKELKHYTINCHLLSKDDVTQWDTELSEPIYLEKVKMRYNDKMIRMLHLIK